MSDLENLEHRMTSAMGRIRSGVETYLTEAGATINAAVTRVEALEAENAELTERLRESEAQEVTPSDAPQDEGRITDLETTLAEERAANAQLDERVQALKSMMETRLKEAEERETRRAEQMKHLDRELQRVRIVNADLRNINDQLRAAAAENITDAHLINQAMEAELFALKSDRAAEQAEVDTILAELKPMIEEAG